MSRPSTWPFPAGPAHREAAPDPLDSDKARLLDEADERDEYDSVFCECDLELMPSELASGKCASCGKKVLA
jgi:hypothetical protein